MNAKMVRKKYFLIQMWFVFLMIFHKANKLSSNITWVHRRTLNVIPYFQDRASRVNVLSFPPCWVLCLMEFARVSSIPHIHTHTFNDASCMGRVDTSLESWVTHSKEINNEKNPPLWHKTEAKWKNKRKERILVKLKKKKSIGR